MKGIDGGPVTNPAAQMDHVGGQGQQILENSGQEFTTRLYCQFVTIISILLAFFTGGGMIYQTIHQSEKESEGTLISRGTGGHMVG